MVHNVCSSVDCHFHSGSTRPAPQVQPSPLQGIASRQFCLGDNSVHCDHPRIVAAFGSQYLCYAGDLRLYVCMAVELRAS